MKISNQKTIKKRRIVAVAIVILLILSIGLILFTYLNKDTTKTDKSTTTHEKETKDGTEAGSTTTTKGDEASQPTTPDSSTTPFIPTGTFVSNHRPNLSGQPAPNRISSTCTTTPGASCTIQFKQGDTIKTLPVTKTNSDGNIYWTWTLQDVGLTAGNWDVTAIATNGDKSSSAADSLQLVIEE